MTSPQELLCGLCREVSRRASRISCCRAQCCWNCGVRYITRERKCWNCPNVSVVTKDLLQDNALREEIKSWNKQKTSDTCEPLVDTEVKPSACENTNSVSIENLNLPEPVPVFSEPVESHDSPAVKEEEEEESCHNDDGLVEGQVDILVTEPTKPTVVDSKEEDEVELSNEPSEISREEERDNTENHLILATIQTLTSTSPVQSQPQQDNPSSSTQQVLDNLEEKLPDSRENINECEENSSVISSETIALLFDPVEDPASKKSPVKIDLKDSFKKLSDRIQVDNPVTKIEEDLEMFENKPSRDVQEKEENEGEIADNSNNESQEIRIIKMVEDVETYDKINKIKEELDKTKQITTRRKSEDVKLTVKPFEVKPIKNALQGLQALLKMSGGGGEKKTEVVSPRDDRRHSRERREERSDKLNRSNKTETEIINRRSRSRSGNSRSHEKKRDRRLSSDHESYKRSRSRSQTKLRRSRSRSRSRSRNQERRSYDESRKENSQSSRYSSTSRQSTSDDPVRRSRRGRSRSRSRENKNRKSTRINRAALVRDREVEDECKTLVERNLTARESVHQTRLQPTRSEKIRQPISSEKKKAVEEDDDDIKVVSYKDVKPKCDSDSHVRIIRSLDKSTDVGDKNGKRKASSSSDKSKKFVKKFVEKERIVRKVYALEKSVDGVSNFEKVTLEKSVKQTKEIHSQEDRASLTPDRKTSLDQIKEELERVKNRVDNIKSKPGDEQESDSDADMKSLMKDVKQMEEEVKDISGDANVKVKPKKRKKDKDKEGDKIKEKEAKITRIKDLESSKKKINGDVKNDIEIDAKLAKKILTSILGSNIGITLNDVIRKEVNKTDHAIEKIKEDLKKQKEDKSKKKRKKEKEEKHRETGTSTNKKFKADKYIQSSSRKENKLEDPETDHHPKKKSKKEKNKSPSKKKKHEFEDLKNSEHKRKKSKSNRDKDRHKKKKSKKKHRRDDESDCDHDEEAKEVAEVADVEKVDNQETDVKTPETNKASQDEFELVIGITDDDVAYLEKEVEPDKEKESSGSIDVDKTPGTASNAVADEEGGESDDEVNLRALLLSQMAAGPRGRSNSRTKISWPPKRQQSEEKDSSVSYTLPQYAYAFSRTFITQEEKQLYFPNLFNETVVELEYSDSESECGEDCEEVWDQRRTTNWVTSRMTDPRFSQAMESLLRQSGVSSPDDCYQ